MACSATGLSFQCRGIVFISKSWKLQNSTGQVGNRLDSTARIVGELRQALGELGKSAEKIYDVGKDISSLQDILQTPKLRGLLGELFLGELLSQVLPAKFYSLQHKFKSGEIVDAVVILNKGMVPIDSKFPLENFKRMIRSENDDDRKNSRKKFISDVRKHIDAIHDKYIRPDEGTLDFGFMYIPAENVFYETIIKEEDFGEEKGISTYALQKNVIPVSPNTFYAYLQSIVLGLKGLQIEKKAREIHDTLRRLQGDFNRFSEDFEIIGKHMNNMRTKYEEATVRAGRFRELLFRAGEMNLDDSGEGD